VTRYPVPVKTLVEWRPRITSVNSVAASALEGSDLGDQSSDEIDDASSPTYSPVPLLSTQQSLRP
jgi:hypothetical protein